MKILAPLKAFDRFQQRHVGLGFAFAVWKKFSDDQAGRLAALIAYYGFFALFPLLLLLVTVLGFVLEGNASSQNAILDTALAKFPVIGPQIKVHSLGGNGLALAVGIVGALLAGLGVTQATQTAFDDVWAVPYKHRPNFISSRLRGLGLLLVLGVLILISTGASGLASGSGRGALSFVLGIAISLAVNFILFFAAFRLLTSNEVPTRDLWAGIAIATILWTILQALGGYFVGHQLKSASGTYGVFALVIGLLSWLYLGAQMLLYAAEVNVVKAKRLWPRGLLDPPVAADREALRALAKIEERTHEQSVEVNFAKSESSEGEGV
jgi:YihY family inner membrane protein